MQTMKFVIQNRKYIKFQIHYIKHNLSLQTIKVKKIYLNYFGSCCIDVDFSFWVSLCQSNIYDIFSFIILKQYFTN